MTLVSCPCEKEIRALVERGQWPQASPAELRSHAANCRTCADLVLVASAFQHARAATVAAARPATPGAIWWRAQLRSRQQAFRRVERPLIGAQIFALAALLLPLVGFAAFEARHGLAWLTWLTRTSQSAQLHAGSLAAGSSVPASNPVFIFVAAAAFALIAGVAVFFATERK